MTSDTQPESSLRTWGGRPRPGSTRRSDAVWALERAAAYTSANRGVWHDEVRDYVDAWLDYLLLLDAGRSAPAGNGEGSAALDVLTSETPFPACQEKRNEQCRHAVHRRT